MQSSVLKENKIILNQQPAQQEVYSNKQFLRDREKHFMQIKHYTDLLKDVKRRTSNPSDQLRTSSIMVPLSSQKQPGSSTYRDTRSNADLRSVYTKKEERKYSQTRITVDLSSPPAAPFDAESAEQPPEPEELPFSIVLMPCKQLDEGQRSARNVISIPFDRVTSKSMSPQLSKSSKVKQNKSYLKRGAGRGGGQLN